MCAVLRVEKGAEEMTPTHVAELWEWAEYY
jgi:hypothetical protein